MNFDNFWPYFLLGAGGALAMELLKLYDYRGKLSQKKYKALFRSWLYWVAVLGMLLASGFIAWALNAALDKPTVWNVVVAGIGAHAMFRDGLTAGSASTKTQLGSELSLRDIFI